MRALKVRNQKAVPGQPVAGLTRNTASCEEAWTF